MGIKSELVGLSDEVWQRTRARVEGLTDEEYLWEPAPGCWTIRPRDDGTRRWEGPLPRPEPEPFTTLAWRLWHVIDCYGEDRAPTWLDVPPQGDPIGLDDPSSEPPATAAEAVALLERAHDRWDAHLSLTDDERLAARPSPSTCAPSPDRRAADKVVVWTSSRSRAGSRTPARWSASVRTSCGPRARTRVRSMPSCER